MILDDVSNRDLAKLILEACEGADEPRIRILAVTAAKRLSRPRNQNSNQQVVETLERNREIIRLVVDEGLSWSEVCRRMKLPSRNIVAGVCHRAGVTGSNRPGRRGRSIVDEPDEYIEE